MAANKFIAMLACLFIYTSFIAGAAAAGDYAGALIPEDSRLLDLWVADNIKSFKERMAVDKKAGVGLAGTGLDPEVVYAENNTVVITVRQDGTGNFMSVNDAVKSIPQHNNKRYIVDIGPGVYTEKVTIESDKPFVMFSGDPNHMPTITYNGVASQYGTYWSATVIVESDYFVAHNIIFQNTSPMPEPGAEKAQAVALRISGDKAAFFNCKFDAFQDTLCDDHGLHFFKDCNITGTVDFIFGNGRSLYLNCSIFSLGHGKTTITAQARESLAEGSGFSFVHCRVKGRGHADLGRAWRERSRVVFAYTYMGKLVSPEGWNNMHHPQFEKTVFYGEYKNTGPGSSTDKRVYYGRKLTDAEAREFLSLEDYLKASSWLLAPAN